MKIQKLNLILTIWLILLGASSGVAISQDIKRISLLSPIASGGEFGWAVTSGDFNGDRLKDVVVSDPVADSANFNTGEVYIYYGKDNFLPIPDQIIPDPEGEMKDMFGSCVDSASSFHSGDTNNDGFDDLLVAMGHEVVYKVYYFKGTPEGLQNTPDEELTAPDGYPDQGFFGHNLSGGGDINDDGFADVLIGNKRSYVGVYYGSAFGIDIKPNLILTFPGPADIHGSIVGDINNDGFDDVAVSSVNIPNESDIDIYIYYGSPSGLLQNPQVLKISVPTGDSFNGVNVAPAGDLNGDDFEDLLIGNQWADGTFIMEGKAYIFYGSNSGLSTYPDVIIDNPRPQYNVRFGKSSEGIGDFNYDGFDDIAIGCPYGRFVSIYYGSPVGIKNVPSLILSERLLVPNQYLGWAVSPVGDIKGNGQNFILVGSEFGAAFLYALFMPVDIDIEPNSEDNCVNINHHGVIPVGILGSADFDVTQIDPTTISLQGMSVKTVGKCNKLLSYYTDLNGDGYVDLLIKIEDSGGNFVEGQTEATLTGALFNGTPIEGDDTICIVHRFSHSSFGDRLPAALGRPQYR